MTPVPVQEDHHTADSAVADRLWEALYLARSGKSGQPIAELEDAAYRFYLPVARSLADGLVADPTSADREAAVQAAELGLARAVLAWRQRTSGGFRRFARSAMMREILSAPFTR